MARKKATRRSDSKEKGRRPARSRPGRLRSGVLSIHPRGFGFVAVDGGGEDIFVPPSAMGSAWHRDRVEVRTKPSDRGPSGEIVCVLERGIVRLGGTLVRGRRGLLLEPGDPRLPEQLRVRGRLPRGVKTGSAVVAEVERTDEASELPTVRVVARLGRAGAAPVEIEKMLLREGLCEEFPGDVRRELEDRPRRVQTVDRRGRRDLSRLALLTIDPPDARDHDDAIWAKRSKDGGWRVVVAIADVAHYVSAGSVLDEEAEERGCTHYLPDRVVPMLPLEISADLASLVPDRDRLAMVVEVDVGPRGGIRDVRFDEAVIRSKARLSYAAVARALGLVKGGRRDPRAERRRPLLRDLYELSRALHARQARRGALFLETPTTEIELDDRGEPADVRRRSPEPGMREAYRIVEQVMLLANEVVATELDRAGFATVYRVHEAPLRERLDELAPIADQLGVPLPKKTASSRAIGDWLTRVERKGLAPMLHGRLLRLLRPAAYEVDNVGHYALAKEHYLHFTSPIRRYPDLVVHRLVKAMIGGASRSVGVAELEAVARRARRRERQAALLSREAQSLYGAVLLKEREGEEFSASITRVSDRGLGLILDDPQVEVQCPLERLPRDRYSMDESGLRLVGARSGRTYALGVQTKVRVVEVSLERREVVVTPLRARR